MQPLIVECEVRTKDSSVTPLENDNKNMNIPLNNSGINWVTNFYWIHCKVIILILIIIISMSKPQSLISTREFDIYNVNFL